MFSKITLKNYRKFSSKELRFSKGINVILGNNEAGKSTIMSAIMNVLHADAQTRSKALYDNISNWATKSADIYLELNAINEKGQYKLVRDFGQQKQFLQNLAENTSIEDYRKIQSELVGNLSIPSKEVFESTSFIRQSELTKISFSSDLKSSLQKVSSLSPSGGNLEDNISVLEKELQQLMLGVNRPSKNIGPIKSTETELGLLQTQYREKTAAWTKFLEAKTVGETSSNRLVELHTEIQAAEAKLNNHKKHEEVTKQLKLLDEQLASVTSVIAQFSKEKSALEQKQSEIDSFPKGFVEPQLTQISEELVKLRQTQKLHKETITELDEKLAKLADEMQTEQTYLPAVQKAERKKFFIGAGGFVAALGILVSGLGVASSQTLLITFGVALVSAGVVAAIYFGLRGGGDGKQVVSEPTEKPELVLLKSQRAELVSKYQAVKQRQLEIISRFGLTDYSEFFTVKARYNTHLQELERLKSALNAISEGKDIAIVEARQLELLTQKKNLEVNEFTPEVRAASLTPNEYLSLRRQLDMLTIEQKRLEKDNTYSQVRTEESNVTAEELASLEEKVELLQSRLVKLKQRAELLNITIGLLQQAIKNTSVSASKVVSQEVEKHLPKLTMGRYSQLRLTEDYQIQVFAEEIKQWILPLGQLSLGTVDQIYFLARVALAKSLLGGSLNYLFLDDPFVSFDNDRLSEMRQILEELSQDTQIFLFTHNPVYSDWGELLQI